MIVPRCAVIGATPTNDVDWPMTTGLPVRFTEPAVLVTGAASPMGPRVVMTTSPLAVRVPPGISKPGGTAWTPFLPPLIPIVPFPAMIGAKMLTRLLTMVTEPFVLVTGDSRNSWSIPAGLLVVIDTLPPA
jgi:hypothetical protein